MTEQYPQYQPPAPPQQDWIKQQVPPPPEPPQKKGSKGRNILIALVAILGLIVIVNIYNNIASVKTASPSVAHVAPAVTPEPSEPAVEEPADTGSDMESDPHFLTYAQVTSAFEQAGFSLVVFHDSVEKGSCFDGAGSSDETIAFVVFKCQYEDMPIVLPEFENSINENTDFHYKVEDANWIVYFTSDSIAYQFAAGYPGSQVEDL